MTRRRKPIARFATPKGSSSAHGWSRGTGCASQFIEKALAKARADAPGRVGDELNHLLVTRTVDDLSRGAR